MPLYTIRDPQSGRSLTVRGENPPTEAELTELFRATREPIAPRSYLQDVGSTLKGEVAGAATALNPLNIVRGVAALPSIAAHPVESATTLIRGVKRLYNEGNAEDIGNAIGQVLGSVVAGKVLPELPSAATRMGAAIPEAAVRGGTLLERAGQATRRVSPFGLAEAAFRADPKGIAVAAAPYAMEYGGRGMRALGYRLGAEAPQMAFTLGAKAPSMESALIDALNEVRQADPTTTTLPARAIATTDLRRPLAVTKPPAMIDTLSPSQAVSGPNRMGAASYGPRGDIRAWLERRRLMSIAQPSATPAPPEAVDALVQQLLESEGLSRAGQSMLNPSDQAKFAQTMQRIKQLDVLKQQDNIRRSFQ